MTLALSQGPTVTSGRRPWIRVEHRVLDAPLSGTEFAVWVVWAQRRSYSDPDAKVWIGRPAVMTRLGRAGKEPSTVTRATARLEKAGLLERQVTMRSSKTRVLYSFPIDPKPYEELDAGIVGLLAADQITPEQLLWLVRFHRACGTLGWTYDSAAEVAARYHSPSRIVRRHRAALVRLGLLEEDVRPGMASRTRKLDPGALVDLLQRLEPVAAWAVAAVVHDDLEQPALPLDDPAGCSSDSQPLDVRAPGCPATGVSPTGGVSLARAALAAARKVEPAP